MAKKYIGLSNLTTFLNNLTNKFSHIGHKHTISDITDYKVDTALSSTSTNSLQNKVINEEFDAVSEAMGALEAAIDDKADTSHNHDNTYYTKTEVDNLELITVNDIDTICGTTISVATASEVKF